MNRSDITQDDIAFLNHIGGELVNISDGFAELAFEIQPWHKQHMGVVHGGAIATLADNAGWYAVIGGLEKGYSAVTIEMKVNYLKPAFGEVLRAEARVINKTKKTAFTTIEVMVKDLVIAYATATFMIQKRD